MQRGWFPFSLAHCVYLSILNSSSDTHSSSRVDLKIPGETRFLSPGSEIQSSSSTLPNESFTKERLTYTFTANTNRHFEVENMGLGFFLKGEQGNGRESA